MSLQASRRRSSALMRRALIQASRYAYSNSVVVPFLLRSFSSTVTSPPSSSSSSTTPSSTTTSSTPTPPHPTLVNIYRSPPPRLVLIAARLFFVQSAASGAFSAAILYTAMTKAAAAAAAGGDATTNPFSVWNAIVDAAASGDMHTTLGTGCAMIAILANMAARGIMDRTVLRMDVAKADETAEEKPGTRAGSDVSSSAAASSTHPTLSLQNASDIIYITRPRLFGGTTRTTHRREHIQGAPPNATIITFRLQKQSSSSSTAAAASSPRIRRRTVDQFLFPVQPGWKSDDIGYLRTLVYGEYFRPEEKEPIPDAKVVAIEGFGPYRPAQFADPHHKAFAIAHQAAIEAGIDPNPGKSSSGGDSSSDSSSSNASSLQNTGSSSSGSSQSNGTGLPPPLSVLPPSSPFTLGPQGTVWAEFHVPPRPSLSDRRAAERAERQSGKASADLFERLPKIAAATDVGLDGKKLVGEEEETKKE